jgi:hypothetical protein
MTRFYLAGKPISGVVMRVDCKVVMREAYVHHPRFPESAYPLIVSIGPTLAQIAEQDGGAITVASLLARGLELERLTPMSGKTPRLGCFMEACKPGMQIN